MSNYSKATNFTAKDSLLTGDPSKKVLGSELDTEYTAIETAIATKADTASPTLTGTITVTGTTIAGAATITGGHTWTSQQAFGTGTPFVFEGATADANETTLAIEDPTADNTVTVPNRTGTILLTTTPGVCVQRVEATPYTTYSSHTTAIPNDNSIPQNTEGMEIITASITPKATTNRLVIRAFFPLVLANGGNINAAIALFQDSTANAIAVSSQTIGANEFISMALTHEMAAGSISATTFKIRIGPDANTLLVNGNASNRLYGGIAAVRLSIEEYAAS